MKVPNSQFTQIPENSYSNKVEKKAQNNLQNISNIQDWLVSYLAELLEIEPEEVDVKVSFDRYGLDSSATIGMSGALEDWLGYEIDPTIVYDYPTIETLAENLLQENKSQV